MQEKNQLPVKKLSKDTSKDVLPSNQWKPIDKASFASAISRVFDLQKQFGKTTAQLENIVEGFAWVLKDYPVEKVIWGLGQYMKINCDIPTPSDICKIIDPRPPQWVPDKQMYYKLQQILKEQGPYGLDNDEIEYCKRYETYMLKAGREGV